MEGDRGSDGILSVMDYRFWQIKYDKLSQAIHQYLPANKELFQFRISLYGIDFYNKASKMVRHSGTKDLFLDFMKQEEGHKKKLEDVNTGRIVLGKIEKIPNLKISDYLVEGELKPDISYAEILRIGMKREERSVKLYTDLKEKNQDEG
jgi:bacterioferritin (cytochrome b1)